MPPAAAAMPATWQEKFVIAYGPDQALLGTAPGGDSGTLDIGPEYGAPAPDGSWWFLDAAKARIAHYDSAGRFMDAVRVSKKLLIGGIYFQWQLPHVLADGTLVAARQKPGRTWLLRLRDGRLDEIPVDGSFSPAYDDGVRLYGFADRGRPVVVDPVDGSMRPTSTFRTPSGTPFSVAVGGRLKLDLPEAAVSKALPVSTASGAAAHVGMQLRAGADDTLHLVLIGHRGGRRVAAAGRRHPGEPLGRGGRGRGAAQPAQRVRPRQPAEAGDGSRLLDADARLRPARRGARLRAHRLTLHRHRTQAPLVEPRAPASERVETDGTEGWDWPSPVPARAWGGFDTVVAGAPPGSTTGIDTVVAGSPRTSATVPSRLLPTSAYGDDLAPLGEGHLHPDLWPLALAQKPKVRPSRV